jgi:hypothetical protein
MSFELKNTVPTFYANLHIAGNFDVCQQECNRITYEFGFCFQVSKVEYIYTGGQESGMLIRVINYPRFPRDPEEITKLCTQFGFRLAEKLCQKSFTLETSTDTMYFESTKHTK